MFFQETIEKLTTIVIIVEGDDLAYQKIYFIGFARPQLLHNCTFSYIVRRIFSANTGSTVYLSCFRCINMTIINFVNLSGC